MKVLRSSHQNLPYKLAKVSNSLLGLYVPLGFWISRHGVADVIDLLPAFAPFVGVSLLGAHVCEV